VATQPSHPFVGGRNEYQRKQGHKHAGTPRDALVPYPWSHSVSWCSAEAISKRKSAPACGPFGWGRTLRFYMHVGLANQWLTACFARVLRCLWPHTLQPYISVNKDVLYVHFQPYSVWVIADDTHLIKIAVTTLSQKNVTFFIFVISLSNFIRFC